MNDFTKVFQQMMEQGQQAARAMNPAMEKFGADMGADFGAQFPTMTKDMMEMFFGNAFNAGGLDAKTRLFVTLGALVAQGSHAEPAITLTVRHARSAGATDKEIAEVIAQMSMFGGVPAMTKAMELANAALAQPEEDSE